MIAVDAIAGHSSNARLTSLFIVPYSQATRPQKDFEKWGGPIECPQLHVASYPTGFDDVPRNVPLVVANGIVARLSEKQKRFAGLRDNERR